MITELPAGAVLITPPANPPPAVERPAPPPTLAELIARQNVLLEENNALLRALSAQPSA